MTTRKKRTCQSTARNFLQLDKNNIYGKPSSWSLPVKSFIASFQPCSSPLYFCATFYSVTTFQKLLYYQKWDVSPQFFKSLQSLNACLTHVDWMVQLFRLSSVPRSFHDLFSLVLMSVLLCGTTEELKVKGRWSSQHVPEKCPLLTAEQRFNNVGHPSKLMMNLYLFIQNKCLFFKMQTYKNCFYVYPKKKITLVENKNIVLTIIFTK